MLVSRAVARAVKDRARRLSGFFGNTAGSPIHI